MSDTLIVGPFPRFVSRRRKESLLNHFGAVHVEHVLYKKKEASVKAKFLSHEKCKKALLTLHQLDIHGKKLVAKYHNDSSPPVPQVPMKEQDGKSKYVSTEDCSVDALKLYEASLSFISSKFNLKHPLPPNLKYSYPPPSATILANICNALASVPKFYTQVLHLMNKMNIVNPFEELTPPNEITLEAAKLVLNANNQSSTSESELESEVELKSDQIQPPKRRKRQIKVINKKPKIDQLAQTYNVPIKVPSPQQPQKPRLTLNVPTEVVPIDETPTEGEEPSGFGKIVPISEKETNSEPTDPYIQMETLQSNRIPESEYMLLPVLRNYSPGETSCKLYIKNLAKNTLESDLKHIFGRFVDWTDVEAVSSFSIKLMKQGRMKGQAFITFKDEISAAKALKETNGFILKDKPMVVVFGKVKSSTT